MAAGYGALVTSIFGAGNSENGSGSGGGYNVNLSHTQNLQQTKGVQTGKTRGVTTSTGRTDQTTTGEQKGTTNTQGTSTTGGTSTTVGTADQGALNVERGIASDALKNANDPSKTAELVKGIINKAAVTYGQTQGGAGAAAGVYNSSTQQLLSGYAQGQAVADSAGAVLNYQQGEQQIAEGAEGQVIEATKGSTTTNNQATTTDTSQQSTLDTISQLLGITKDQGTTQQTNVDKNRTSQDTVSNIQQHGAHGTSNTFHQAGDSGGVFSSLSVVCKEMKNTGKMDRKLWAIVTKDFNDNHNKFYKEAYWSWAIPFVKYMRKYPNSTAVKFICYLTEERAIYVAALRGHKNYKFKAVGFLSYLAIGYGSIFCGLFTVLLPKLINKYSSNSKEGAV